MMSLHAPIFVVQFYRMAALFLPVLFCASLLAAKLNVVATTGMIADAAQQIGGERVEIHALMGSGVDPHTYRQTRSDITKLARADLVLWHGLNLEAQLTKLFSDLARRKPVIALAESIPKDKLLASEADSQHQDPHVWMDTQLWRYVIEATRDAFIKADPLGKSFYENSSAKYLQAVVAMRERSARELSMVPTSRRVLVTAHDAFRYFGRAYGYEVLSIQGISTESEASLKRIETLVEHLVRQKINAIFIESSVSDQNIRALIEGAAMRGHKVIIGGELFSDAMGVPGTIEGTYIGMIEHNAKIIARTLAR